MLLRDIMCLRKDICFWNKMYFFGLSFKFVDFNLLKIEVRFFSVFLNVDLKVMILFRYIRYCFYCNLESMVFISCLNVVGLLERLNGKILN